jgi:hypothetical protein
MRNRDRIAPGITTGIATRSRHESRQAARSADGDGRHDKRAFDPTPCFVFRRMLERGHPPEDWDAPVRASEAWRPEEAD